MKRRWLGLISLMILLFLPFSMRPKPQEGTVSAFAELEERVQTELLASAIALLTPPDTPYVARLAVGGVLLNRLEHPSFGDSLFEVVSTQGVTVLPDRADEGALQAAQDLLSGLNPLPKALYFGRGAPPEGEDNAVSVGGYWFSEK